MDSFTLIMIWTFHNRHNRICLFLIHFLWTGLWRVTLYSLCETWASPYWYYSMIIFWTLTRVTMYPYNTLLSLLVTGHRLCTEFARLEDWGFSDLFVWTCLALLETLVLLGLAVTDIFFFWVVAMASLVYICLSLPAGLKSWQRCNHSFIEVVLTSN